MQSIGAEEPNREATDTEQVVVVVVVARRDESQPRLEVQATREHRHRGGRRRNTG